MIRLFLLAVLWGSGASALTLDLPAPAVQSASDTDSGMATLPAGPFDGGDERELRELRGTVTRTAWRLPGQGEQSERFLAPVREAVEAAGYQVIFECADASCGGYDFRFALDLLPAPAMFVDLGAFRYVLAERDDGALVALLASRAGDAGYLHVTDVVPDGAASDPAVMIEGSVPAGPLWERLRDMGRAALDDLSFATGSARLANGSYASLEALAAGLKANPTARVTLVGHTDTEGEFDSNLALSRARAAAVRQALIDDHGADPSRIAAEGVAYLAPRASNADAAGRETNRRVEVVLTSP